MKQKAGYAGTGGILTYLVLTMLQRPYNCLYNQGREEFAGEDSEMT